MLFQCSPETAAVSENFKHHVLGVCVLAQVRFDSVHHQLALGCGGLVNVCEEREEDP